MKPKVYDCFTYFNEDRLLKLRLETLWDVVDYFVICESVLTFSGNSKPVNFKIENFQKYQSKIRYLLIEDFPFESKDPWVYEGYQRNYLSNGLHDANEKDWIILSDVDEIPNPSSISSFNPYRYIRGRLAQKGYAYFLNNLHVENSQAAIWDKAKITTVRNFHLFFGTMEQLREYRPKGFLRGMKRFFINKIFTQTLANAGWHFTWMGSADDMVLKLESFSHQELNTQAYKNKADILKKIRSGKDLFDRGFTYQLVSLDSDMPSYISSHKDEFDGWVLDHAQEENI